MKKIFSYFSILFVLLFLINSCRTNEIVENENTKKEKIDVFVKYYEKLKTSKTADQNYNKPFAKILANYLNKHDDYRTIFENEIGIIDLSKSSQTFDNGSKTVLFPLINNQNDIVNILCCYINEDLDFVEFDVLENSLIKTEIINTFKNYKTKSIAKEKIKEGYIEVVIITQAIPKNPKNSHLIFPYSNNEIPEIMNGGADIHNGGGGGSYDGNLEEMLNDPCEKAKKPIKRIADFSHTTQYLSAKNTMINMTNKDIEYGLYFGKENNIIIPGTIKEGSANSCKPQHNFSNPISIVHTHTGNTPPSSGDVYALIQDNLIYPNLESSIIITKDNTTYALVVIDSAAASLFLQNYPPNQIQPNVSPNFPGQMFDDWYNSMFDWNASEENALAYILDKYNTGLILSKIDSNGKLQKINIKQEDVSGTIKYTTYDCN
jgi:hypothetical protein